jgi:hypothetical protein
MSCTPGTVYLDRWLIILYTSCRNCLNNMIIFCLQIKPASSSNNQYLDLQFFNSRFNFWQLQEFFFTSASICRNELSFLVAFKASLIP